MNYICAIDPDGNIRSRTIYEDIGQVSVDRQFLEVPIPCNLLQGTSTSTSTTRVLLERILGKEFQIDWSVPGIVY